MGGETPLARRASHAFALIMRINWLPRRTFWLLHSPTPLPCFLILRPRGRTRDTRAFISFSFCLTWLCSSPSSNSKSSSFFHCLSSWALFLESYPPLPPIGPLAYFCKRLIFNFPPLCGLATCPLPLLLHLLLPLPTVCLSNCRASVSPFPSWLCLCSSIQFIRIQLDFLVEH